MSAPHPQTGTAKRGRPAADRWFTPRTARRDIVGVRVATCVGEFTVIGTVATFTGVLAALPFSATVAWIAWALGGCLVAALLGIGFDHLTTRLLRRDRGRPASPQQNPKKGHTT
ncbi:hypothetical protein [Streptomyces sp. NPDC054834]